MLIVAFVATGCRADQDARDLRNRIQASADVPRTYMIRTASPDGAYEIDATLEDDLRYALELKSSDGQPLLDYVVRDDALAVRILDPAFAAKLANSLGDPIVDKALRSGRWVVDPAGAPPVTEAFTPVVGETSGNPLQDARGLFQFVASAMAQAQQVKKFSLEDIEYRSKYDPWRYPADTSGEVRYDMVRPVLPKSEAAGGATTGNDVGPASFRKLSVFVAKGRVDEVCEYVDILGHEDFVALRQRGLRSNPFLATLLQRIRTGDTAVPIKPRYMVATIDYSSKATVDLPANALIGKLQTFSAALTQALTAGVLRPTGTVDTSECVRSGSANPTLSL